MSEHMPVSFDSRFSYYSGKFIVTTARVVISRACAIAEEKDVLFCQWYLCLKDFTADDGNRDGTELPANQACAEG